MMTQITCVFGMLVMFGHVLAKILNYHLHVIVARLNWGA